MRGLFGKKPKKKREFEDMRARFTDEEWEDLKVFMMVQFLGATEGKMDKLLEVQQKLRDSPRPHPLITDLFMEVDKQQLALVLRSGTDDSFSQENLKRVRPLLESKLSGAELGTFMVYLDLVLNSL